MGSAAGAREESEGGLGKRFVPVFFEKFCLRQTAFYQGKVFGKHRWPLRRRRVPCGNARARQVAKGHWRSRRHLVSLRKFAKEAESRFEVADFTDGTMIREGGLLISAEMRKPSIVASR